MCKSQASTGEALCDECMPGQVRTEPGSRVLFSFSITPGCRHPSSFLTNRLGDVTQIFWVGFCVNLLYFIQCCVKTLCTVALPCIFAPSLSPKFHNPILCIAGSLMHESLHGSGVPQPGWEIGGS